MSTNKDLNIDQAKSWSFKIDDIDEVQSDLPLMNKFAADAGERMKIAVDRNCLEYVVGKAATTNKGAAAGAISGAYDMGSAGAPLSITKTNATDVIVDINTILDEANIPSADRYVVLPAWFCALLKKSELKQADVTGDAQGLIRSGVLGMIDRTKIIQSNNLHSVVDGTTTKNAFYCFGGTSAAMTFAAQLTNTESLRRETSFGEYMRGLQVFGREVVQDTAMVELYADIG